MKLEDVIANRGQLECFHCGSKLDGGDGKFIALETAEGVIEIMNQRTGHKAPMVFESSDCMVYDSSLRYTERLQNRTFRKKFNQTYNDAGNVPVAFRNEEYDKAVNEFQRRTG